MMYDELIGNLRAKATHFHFNDETSLLLCKAADAIEELQKQLREEKVDNVNLTGWLAEEHAKHLWIPVTERLPEDGQRVLVFYWLDLKPKKPWCKVCYFASNLQKVDKYDFDGCNYPGFCDCDSEWGYYQHDDVTHWMPLPEPPTIIEAEDGDE